MTTAWDSDERRPEPEGTRTREMIQMTDLLAHLQEAGYEPLEPSGHTGDWYDLVVSGTGTVRACLGYPDGDYADVYLFDAGMICKWQVTLANAPAGVVIAVLEAAEWQLARRRGGPITPAQAVNAS